MPRKHKVWPEGMKGRARCGQVKPLANFTPRGNYFHSYCRECRNECAREWNKAHPEKVREIVYRYRAKHPGRVRMYVEIYRRRNRECINRISRERYHADPVFRRKLIDRSISYSKANRSRNLHKHRDNTFQAYHEVSMLREEYEAYFRERSLDDKEWIEK